MKHQSDMRPYRVGFGRDVHIAFRALRRREWFIARARLRWMVSSVGRRSYWGIWQVEWPGCQRAVRGLTSAHALRRAEARRV